MEENKNDIDELVKSIDSSFKEMSLKDIVAAHEDYFGTGDIDFDDDDIAEKQKNIEKTEPEESDIKGIKEKNDDVIRQAPEEDITNNEKNDEDISQEDAIRKLLGKEKTDAPEEDVLEEKSMETVAQQYAGDVEKKESTREEKIKMAGRIGNWFQTFCYMRIPVIGFIYILVLAFSKKTPESKKEFARGYILYKVLVWILAVVLLYCLYKVGLGFVEGMLSFIKE